MRVSFLLLICSLLFPVSSLANQNSKELNPDSCAYGSHKELYQFFTDQKYVVIAQAKRIQDSGDIKDFADVIFLLSTDMAYFHAVTLSGIKYDHFEACIFTSAQEVDFQFAPPVPNLLSRKNREHLVFLIKDIPKNAPCPNQKKSCMTWQQWSPLLEQTFLLSAYHYANDLTNNPYHEIVELTLDNKTIRPTRGVLAEHARVKYAIRLRNELKESAGDIKAAKQAYIDIHNEVDHNLPLVFLSLEKDRRWRITQVDRISGLAETLLHGVELELYPMKQDGYLKLLQE